MDRKLFYKEIRKGLGRTQLTAKQVSGFEEILASVSGLDITWQAYLLATAWHETAFTMQPVRETLADTDQKAVNRLENAWKAGKLKWVRTPYWRFDAQGKTWLGRGYVQLTHQDNYRKASALTDVDLLSDPNKAMQPTVAAKILVEGSKSGMFTGKKLSDYLPGDYVNARRIINGTDKARQIAQYAMAFEDALRAASVVSAEPVMPDATPDNSGSPAVALAGLITIIAGAAALYFDKVKDWLSSIFGG